jgi:hypothetical protein
MGKRHDHTFRFAGKAIAHAAAGEAHYHHQRVKWWKAEHEKAIAAAKGAGIEIRSYEVTGGTQAQVVIDPTLSQRLTQCENKIRSHQQAADRFQIEADAYDSQPKRLYECHPDDIVYFRLVGGAREE